MDIKESEARKPPFSSPHSFFFFFFFELFKEETTSLVSDFHVGPPYKNKLIATIIIKYLKYKN